MIGLCFASLSGLIGIGGGTLFVPYLTSKGISMRLAIGIASCLGLFIGLCSSITLLLSWDLTSANTPVSMLGPIYIPAIIFLTLPSLIFINLSAGWLQKISDKNIRRGFAYLLIFISFMMILKDILKPSETTPLTAIALKQLANRAGIPDEVFQLV